jgi:hypothetical protein
MAYKIKAMGVGGILDQAISVTKDNFGLLFGIMAGIYLPIALLQSFLPVMLSEQLDAPTLGIIALVFGVIAGLFVLPISNAAVTYAVSERYLGRDVSFGEALKFGVTQIGPLVWTSILMGLAIMGGFILLIIPGILFALWFGLAQQVVVLEGINGAKALGRSKTLVRPNLGTMLILSFILGIIGMLMGMGAAMIPQVHVQLFVICLLNTVVTMLTLVAMVIFYFSCRCKVENFDLEHLAASIGEATPETKDARFGDE